MRCAFLRMPDGDLVNDCSPQWVRAVDPAAVRAMAQEMLAALEENRGERDFVLSDKHRSSIEAVVGHGPELYFDMFEYFYGDTTELWGPEPIDPDQLRRFAPALLDGLGPA